MIFINDIEQATKEFSIRLFADDTSLTLTDKNSDQLIKKANVAFKDVRAYGEIFFISRLELVHKVLTPKMKKKLGVTNFDSEKMAVEKCLNFEKLVIMARCSLVLIHRKS